MLRSSSCNLASPARWRSIVAVGRLGGLLRSFGTCLFGRCDFFPGTGKYSFASLVQGRAGLACADLFGSALGLSKWSSSLFSRRAVEMCQAQGARYLRAGRARGVGMAEEDRGNNTGGAWRARRLTIVPCNKALYALYSDSRILENS